MPAYLRLPGLVALTVVLAAHGPACAQRISEKPASAPVEVGALGDWTLSVANDSDQPLRIVDAVYDYEKEELAFQLENVSDQPVTGWTLGLPTAFDGVRWAGRMRYSTDAWERKAGWIRGGERRRTRLSIQAPTVPDGIGLETTVRIDVAIFDSTSYAGDPAAARSIFESRGTTWRDAVHWLEMLETTRENADSPAEGAQVLVALNEGLAAKLAVGSVGSLLIGDLDDNLRHAREYVNLYPDQAIPTLDLLIGRLRTSVERSQSATPSAFLGSPTPGSQGMSFRGKGGCSWLAIVTTQSSGSSVDETWNFTCGPGSASGNLFATGQDDCSPKFEGDATEAKTLNPGALHSWRRSAQSRTDPGMGPLGCLNSGDPQVLEQTCACASTSPTDPPDQREDTNSPILLDLERDGFALTGLDDPVRFDFDGDGNPETVGWTEAGTDDAFLVLDRDGNGTIDSGAELFGNYTPQPASRDPNGFLALAVYDAAAEGGDGDGWISSADAVFGELQLWHDRNDDGVSQAAELSPLASSQVEGIRLDHITTARQDAHGNRFRWSSLVRFEQGRKLAAVDVIFVGE